VPAPQSALPLEGLNALVVTASPITGPLVARQIQDAGAHAMLVTSGTDARAALAKGSFTSLICDATLPDMSGEALMREASREETVAPKIVVLLPVGARKADIKEKGFDGFLIKPVRQGSLTQRLALLHGRAAAAPDEEASRARPTRKRVRRRKAGDKLSILLAEDNDINALLAISLVSREGHKVERVTNGREALEAARAKTYDLVLMDVHMPEMDGLEATRNLRAQGLTDLPIIALTANAMAGDRRECLDAGMNDYLAKPLDPDLLLEAIARWTGKSEPTPQALAAGA